MLAHVQNEENHFDSDPSVVARLEAIERRIEELQALAWVWPAEVMANAGATGKPE
jgi:hypothetical protein